MWLSLSREPQPKNHVPVKAENRDYLTAKLPVHLKVFNPDCWQGPQVWIHW